MLLKTSLNSHESNFVKASFCSAVKRRIIEWTFPWRFFVKFLPVWINSSVKTRKQQLWEFHQYWFLYTITLVSIFPCQWFYIVDAPEPRSITVRLFQACVFPVNFLDFIQTKSILIQSLTVRQLDIQYWTKYLEQDREIQ